MQMGLSNSKHGNTIAIMTQTMIERIQYVHKQIATAAHRAGRDPQEITLIAVTKTQPVEVIRQSLDAGIRHIGENRVQEAQQKQEFLSHALESATSHQLVWHLIGHLQRNKARVATGLFHCIHSVDSVRLAETLNHSLQKTYTDTLTDIPSLPVLLQINVSGEASKEGFDVPGGLQNQAHLPQFFEDVERILALPYLKVQGLMTIAPFVSDTEQVRPVFRNLRRLRDTLQQHFPSTEWKDLSMGMTADFAVAIEEGATIVRIGRALFGER